MCQSHQNRLSLRGFFKLVFRAMSLKLGEAVPFKEVPCLENALPCFRLTVITDFEFLHLSYSKLHGNSLKNSS